MNPGAHVIPDDEFDDVFYPNVRRNDDIPLAQDGIQPVIKIERNDVAEQDTGKNYTAPTTINPASTRMGTRSKPSNKIIQKDVGQQVLQER
jgi:hypothetical protein